MVGDNGLNERLSIADDGSSLVMFLDGVGVEEDIVMVCLEGRLRFCYGGDCCLVSGSDDRLQVVLRKQEGNKVDGYAKVSRSSLTLTQEQAVMII